ncbi:MAG: hypothetical protein BWY11_00456 [Firmicutes bacterium ADurb.Bin182]|nr:MAG: hypothetical protein BWY11_00456 [Firmicutes bacterium ADurb.Bin182]
MEILQEIECRIDLLSFSKALVIVAIDGSSGAGKSTLAAQLNDRYDLNVFHMDDFFLPPALKTEERLNEAGGNADYERFKREVIDGIHSLREFEYRTYNCSVQKFDTTVRIKPKKLNIIEGVYSMHPSLSGFYDLKIFMKTDLQKQRERILARSSEEVLKRFMKEWIPLENRYFRELKIEENCDLVFVV